jgi:hypothetical protein
MRCGSAPFWRVATVGSQRVDQAGQNVRFGSFASSGSHLPDDVLGNLT